MFYIYGNLNFVPGGYDRVCLLSLLVIKSVSLLLSAQLTPFSPSLSRLLNYILIPHLTTQKVDHRLPTPRRLRPRQRNHHHPNLLFRHPCRVPRQSLLLAIPASNRTVPPTQRSVRDALPLAGHGAFSRKDPPDDDDGAGSEPL